MVTITRSGPFPTQSRSSQRHVTTAEYTYRDGFDCKHDPRPWPLVSSPAWLAMRYKHGKTLTISIILWSIAYRVRLCKWISHEKATDPASTIAPTWKLLRASTSISSFVKSSGFSLTQTACDPLRGSRHRLIAISGYFSPFHATTNWHTTNCVVRGFVVRKDECFGRTVEKHTQFACCAHLANYLFCEYPANWLIRKKHISVWNSWLRFIFRSFNEAKGHRLNKWFRSILNSEGKKTRRP